MIESMLCFVGEDLVEAQQRKSRPRRRGNRNPERAPQGVYPCAGDDRWIALSVTHDDEWIALCEAAGLDPELRGLDSAGRAAAHDTIDEMLAAWTRAREVNGLAAELQERGIIAAPVRDARDLACDPHLAARGFWVTVEHTAIGRRVQPGVALHLSANPASCRRAAPCLGEHNREVLREILSLADVELEALEARGVLCNRPPAGATFRGVERPADAQGVAQPTAATQGPRTRGVS
jgi:benzylsuccinate CoA-transferase BbsF subunit